jgi:hypothetical protein
MDDFDRPQGEVSGGYDINSKLIYVGVSAIMVFGLVYLVGRAWKKSQTA